MKKYAIDPYPKPRMTRSDGWKKRPVVLKYWKFCKDIEDLGVTITNEPIITFVVRMPKSWSKKKKAEMEGKPHQQTPDLDNYIKALFDACKKEDKAVWSVCAQKIWGYNGEIIIE